MLNLQKLAINLCVEELRSAYERTYSTMEQQLGNIIMWSGRLVLENIANSDALYHNVEHTVMVTLAGQSIIEGKHLLEGGVAPRDWVHYMMAVLCHDIGYVRGICGGDRDGTVATGIGDETVEIPHGASDAALSPYHVDRSKLFVRERFGKGLLMGMVTNIDAELIASYIEMSRFPVPDDDWYKDTEGYPGLVRAADFIGQLGDPNRPRKSPALFFEFEETGSNEELGYKRPGDLHDNYAKFYWDVVSPYIQEALRYLRVTQEGKQWIANLYANVFGAEHGCHIYRTCS
ncbi:MAG: hypothetical protein P8X67_15670 [Syntrophobacterales bacterium]